MSSERLKCGTCGKEKWFGEKFCDNCGTEFPTSVLFLEQMQEEDLREQHGLGPGSTVSIECTGNCSQIVAPQGVNFCPNCGAKFLHKPS